MYQAAAGLSRPTTAPMPAGDAIDLIALALAEGAGPDDAGLAALVADVLVEAIAAFGTDAGAVTATTTLRRLDPMAAAIALDLLVNANFPDGAVDLVVLDDPVVLCLAELLSTAGRHADAAALIAEAAADSTRSRMSWGRWAVRTAVLECSPDIVDHWPAAADLAAVQARALAKPLDLDAHRALAAALAAAGDVVSAARAMGVALTLPVGERDKLVLANDLALLIAFALARGDKALLADRVLGWPVAGLPNVAQAALARLDRDPPAFADPGLVEDARAWIGGLRRSPYPLVNGRPHIDTVWLEITNHCNQKCTFCPDMDREDARAWLPLAEVKRLIDEMAATMSIGSMQLNAYGEPLLHPDIAEILRHIRAKGLPWPTFFTSHGMTLVDKKLAQLSHNYPAGIAISLHNDSQESYAATRRGKIGDYDTLVGRVTALMRQMVDERADCHLRLYQMVHNAQADREVDPDTRAAFPDTPERMLRHVRKWEAIAAEIAAAAPSDARATPLVNDVERIEEAFATAQHWDTVLLPVLEWTTVSGHRQQVFMSARPVGTYANLLLEYDDRWTVSRSVVNRYACSFTATPSLAIFATGRLGVCCLDMNSTATFGALSDYPSLVDAVTSPEALAMFGQLANGVAVSRGCQICLSTDKQFCATKPRRATPDPRAS